MALTASFDKSEYDPGEEIVLTVKTDPNERNSDVPINVHVFVEGVGEVDLSSLINKPDAAVRVTDSARVWSLVSDNGSTAVFKAIAA